MNNRLAEQLFRGIEFATAIAPSRFVADLETSQWFDRAQIEALQRERLHQLFDLARRDAPFYRDKLPQDLSHQLENAPLEAILNRLPLLTKEGLRNNPTDLRTGIGRRNIKLSTSGSTGQPLAIEIDRLAFARGFAAKLRAMRWYNVRFSDRQFRIWGRTTHSVGKLWWAVRDRLQNRLRLTTVDLSDTVLENMTERLSRFHPTYVNGYSSGIYRFAQYLNEHRIDTSDWGVQLVMATSEVLFPSQREEIASAFGAPVISEYGCGEVHAIGYECPMGRMHISHEHMLLELLDEDGQPVAPGVPGRVTATSLLNRAMPLIRYQNGDLAEWSPDGDCPCGRQPGLPTVRTVTGRTSDILLKTDGTQSHWGALFYAFKESFPPGCVAEHQARQTALNRLEVQVVPGEQFDPKTFEVLTHRLRQTLGDPLTVDCQTVEAIDRGSTGKLKYFISDIEPPRDSPVA